AVELREHLGHGKLGRGTQVAMAERDVGGSIAGGEGEPEQWAAVGIQLGGEGLERELSTSRCLFAKGTQSGDRGEDLGLWELARRVSRRGGRLRFTIRRAGSRRAFPGSRRLRRHRGGFLLQRG